MKMMTFDTLILAPSNWLQSSDFGVAIIRDGIVVNVFFLLEEQAGRSRSDVVVSQFMVYNKHVCSIYVEVCMYVLYVQYVI